MRKLVLMTITLAGLLTGSCLRDRFDGGTGKQAAKSDFRLRVTLDALESELAMTRATVKPTEDEEKVQNIALLFFNRTGDASGLYQGAVLLEDGPYRMNADIPISFAGTGLDGLAAYNILLMANGNESYLDGMSVADWTASLQGNTERQVYEESRVRAHVGDAISANEILMTAHALREAGQSLVSATMIRAVSRFDVINSKVGDYNLVSTSVWNAHPETSAFGGGVIDYSSARLQRFYGIDNTANGYADIIGGLYSFENRVVSPERDDNKTTCLVIGLAPASNVDFDGETWTAGTTKYFRVNINSVGSAQALKRNNAYRLTIRNVIGMGADSEEEAYTNSSNNLVYVINYWDLDDDGLIVYDGSNLLAIPTKMARLAPEGETRSLNIFTFGNGTLAIKTQNFNGTDKIRATLDGNTLNITAQPLGGDPARTGYVELSFAGLTATINVIQSGDSGLYLEVSTPEGVGIPPFLSSVWYPSDWISVKASGSWTATTHMEGFSFGNGLNKTVLTSSEVPDNRFRIYTNSVNTGTAPREAFVLVKLDADPDNYNAALLLTQKAAGALNLLPSSRTISFLANRALDVSQSAYSATNVFNVYPTVDNGNVSPWKAEILPVAGVTSGDVSLFEFFNPSTMQAEQIQFNASDVEGNRIGVRPLGMNVLSRDLKATLRISLRDEPSVFTEIALIQRGFDVSSTTVQAVSEDGGVSDVVNLTSGLSDLKWQVESVSTYTNTAPRILNHHAASVLDQNSNAITPGSSSQVYDLTQGFRVSFPKVYFPNRDKTIYADVTLNLGYMDGADFMVQSTYTVSVEQESLRAKSIVAGSMYNSFGGIGPSGSYFAYFRNMLTNTSIFGTGKPVPLGPVVLPTSNIQEGNINNNINYLNANMPNMNYTTAQFQRINTWRQNDGVLLVGTDMTTAYNDLFTNSNSIFYQLGITRNGNLSGGIGTDNRNARTVNTDNTANTRIGQFVTTEGVFPFTAGTMNSYYGDGTSAAVNLTGKTGDCKAVALIGLNDNKVGLFIDPANRIVFIGEGQFVMADTGAYDRAGTVNAEPANYYDKLLANIVTYVVYTAAYGSHFSDLLVDDFTVNGQVLPAPWDPSWSN